MYAMTERCARCGCTFGEHERDENRCPVGGGTFEQIVEDRAHAKSINLIALAVVDLYNAIKATGHDRLEQQFHLDHALDRIRHAAPDIFGED